jgi:hypothetical protein
MRQSEGMQELLVPKGFLLLPYHRKADGDYAIVAWSSIFRVQEIRRRSSAPLTLVEFNVARFNPYGVGVSEQMETPLTVSEVLSRITNAR